MILLLIPLITIAAQSKKISEKIGTKLSKNTPEQEVLITAERAKKEVAPNFQNAPTPVVVKTLSHRQIVWRNALEWCESNGNKEAINPNDEDNTPSYYSFQWKPGTFKSYAIKYGVIPANTTNEKAFELMKDYNLQVKVVDNMILDQTIKWNIQFPGCTKKIGNPPRS